MIPPNPKDINSRLLIPEKTRYMQQMLQLPMVSNVSHASGTSFQATEMLQAITPTMEREREDVISLQSLYLPSERTHSDGQRTAFPASCEEMRFWFCLALCTLIDTIAVVLDGSHAVSGPVQTVKYTSTCFELC